MGVCCCGAPGEKDTQTEKPNEKKTTKLTNVGTPVNRRPCPGRNVVAKLDVILVLDCDRHHQLDQLGRKLCAEVEGEFRRVSHSFYL